MLKNNECLSEYWKESDDNISLKNKSLPGIMCYLFENLIKIKIKIIWKIDNDIIIKL